MQPQVSLVLDDGTGPPLNLLTVAKHAPETDPELRGKHARFVLPVLHPQLAFAFAQKVRDPYYFRKYVFFFLSFKWMAVMTKPVRVAAAPETT